MTLASSLSLSLSRRWLRSPHALLTGLGPDGARIPLFAAFGDGLVQAVFGKVFS